MVLRLERADVKTQALETLLPRNAVRIEQMLASNRNELTLQVR